MCNNCWNWLSVAIKLRVSTLDVESPSVKFSSAELKDLTKDINMKEIESIENFDIRFYRNQIALCQHDARPTADNETKLCVETKPLKIYVLAKRVVQPKDIACWITVEQKRHLGSGVFSDVYCGTVKPRSKSGLLPSPTNMNMKPRSVAIKKLWPDPALKEELQISIHRLLDHHNIVKLYYYYVCVHPKTRTLVWTLLLEPMSTTILQELIRLREQNRLMHQTYVKVFMYQTFSGLAYMEKHNILHRDLKPDNLLVDMDTGLLKIGDFGSSKRYNAGTPSLPYQVTRYFRAPELCLQYCYYGATVDVWAAGCVLCQLLTNKTLFHGRNNDDQFFKIVMVCGTPTMEQLQQCVPGLQIQPELLKLRFPPANWHRILCRYNERITTQCSDFVSKILRYEANLRLRGEHALNHAFFDDLRDPNCTLPNGRQLPYLSL